MSTRKLSVRCRALLLLCLLALSAACPELLQGQLAITEIMSYSAAMGNSGPDYFELTWYGTSNVDLSGYAVCDAGGTPVVSNCFGGVILGPRESVVFFRSQPTSPYTREQFLAWWGNPLEGQAYPYDGFGFDRKTDSLSLFSPDGRLIDRVEVGFATAGVAFAFDGCEGVAELSRWPQDGVIQAGTGDIGSPGSARGPCAMQITRQPESVGKVCEGSEVSIQVKASGFPRPRFQWSRDGVELTGATSSTLRLQSVGPQDSGEYRVLLSNGLGSVLSEAATVLVDDTVAMPAEDAPMEDCERFEGEPAEFLAHVCAAHAACQWFENGREIPNATNRTLMLETVDLSMNGYRYRVAVSNAAGAVSSEARLRVHPKPVLEITEVMPLSMTNQAGVSHGDWFELTNMGTDAVPLGALKVLDRDSPDNAVSLSTTEELLPGESAIVVESLSRAQFAAWWGGTNLPLNLKVITFQGVGLSELSDDLFVWGKHTVQKTNHVCQAFWASVPAVQDGQLVPYCPDRCDPELTGVPLIGRSIWFDLDGDCAFGNFGRGSIAGANGAFTAAESGDHGSPGFFRCPVALTTTVTAGGIELAWRVIRGRAYALELVGAVGDQPWAEYGRYTAEGSLLVVRVPPESGQGAGFYRLRLLP